MGMLKRTVLLVGLVLAPAALARNPAPGFLRQSLRLPGMPAAVIPADVDGDGHEDLVVLVAYRKWEDVAEFEQSSFHGIEGLVEVMSVVTSLLDRRELRVYPGTADGSGFGPQLASLELPTSVHALEAGPPSAPLVALTDDGVAAVRLEEEDGQARLALAPLLASVTSLSGSDTFYSGLRLLHDLDGDGRVDLLLPTPDGWSLYRGTDSGFDSEPMTRVAVDRVEEDEDEEDEDGRRHPILPEVKDVNGDRRPDLVVFGVPGSGPLVYLNASRGSFAPGIELELEGDHGEIVFVGDLDGDGRAEVVSQKELEKYDDPTWRQEVEEAKRPLSAYGLYRLGKDLATAPEPYRDFQAVGYTFSDTDDEDIQLPGGFQDLDGDGRLDLVSITLDFSLLPMVMRVLTTRRISLRMDFQVWCQAEGGRFSAVPDLDLSGRFKIDLENLKVKHLSQFAGDFNGDGRADFVQMGRGRKVTIHSGGPGCRYPRKPDRKIVLEREPKHLGLVRILDLDANGRSDLYFVYPEDVAAKGETMPARVDIYLSEESR